MTEAATEQTVETNATSESNVVESAGAAAGGGVNVDGECEEEEEDEDEEEAEAIARRLKEQLWADINRAQAARTVPSARPPSHMTPAVGHGASVPKTALSKKQDAALQTMKDIIAIVSDDKLAHSTLASAVVPGTDGDNVLNVLDRVVRAGLISKELAKSLTPVLVSLARSDTLFATMRHSNAPAIQLDKGKRKRDESEEEERQNDARTAKRPNVAYPDLQRQITDAVKIVSDVLNANAPRDEMNALQEIGGLIQVLGILSGIQIGPTATPNHAVQPAPAAPHPSHPWTPQGAHPVPFPDIGTAVYPCLVPGCRKVFARLYSLRAHQRVHALHRPFRCAACPASFARNHDLKRHAKLHEKKAWQCAGCDKLFSRRDAIKRHKNSSAARGGKGQACVDAAVREVVLDSGEDDAAREGRRTRMWADMAVAGAAYHGHAYAHGGLADGQTEEGEVQGEVVRRMQAAVLSLHGTLQGRVSAALGTDHAAPPLHLDPTGGQATLASVIARAQMQSWAGSQIRGGSPSGDVGDLGGSVCPDDGLPASLDSARTVGNEAPPEGGPAPPLSLYGLSEEQTKLLEQAIANAASAAQAQAEAEAALEEEDEEEEDDGEAQDANENNDTLSSSVAPTSAVP